MRARRCAVDVGSKCFETIFIFIFDGTESWEEATERIIWKLRRTTGSWGPRWRRSFTRRTSWLGRRFASSTLGSTPDHRGSDQRRNWGRKTDMAGPLLPQTTGNPPQLPNAGLNQFHQGQIRLVETTDLPEHRSRCHWQQSRPAPLQTRGSRTPWKPRSTDSLSPPWLLAYCLHQLRNHRRRRGYLGLWQTHWLQMWDSERVRFSSEINFQVQRRNLIVFQQTTHHWKFNHNSRNWS